MVSYRGPYRHLLQVVRLGALVSVVVSAAVAHVAVVDAAAVAIAPDPVLYEPAAAVAAVELLRDAVVVVPVVVLALRRVHHAAAVAVA